MADLKNTGASTDGTETTTKIETSNVDDKSVSQPSGEKTFDESVFDDPRLWEHPRFKTLNERAKQAKVYEAQLKEQEEKTLAESKKFEELATIRAKERDDYRGKFLQTVQDNKIIQEASKVGVVDVEAVLKLVNRENIRVDDDGNITGAIEAVNALVESKPYLKNKTSTTTLGTPSNPSSDADLSHPRFKLSQLSDPAFYRDHEADILKAYKLGLIEDDLAK